MCTPKAWFASVLVFAVAIGPMDVRAADPNEQSPVDIVTADVFRDPDFLPIVFSYSRSAELTVRNIDAPNVEGTIRGIPSAGSTLSYDGATYDLLQFHFHIDSEHEIDGRRFPMEMHFVNQKSGSTDGNDLLVVGRFIEVSDTPNATLSPLFDGLGAITLPDQSFSLTNFDIQSLAPIGQPEYRYTGSLTTAPYTEGVNWNVFYGAPLALSQEQIDAFHAIFTSGNSREVQPLDGRIVTTAVPELDPASWAGVCAMLVGSLALMERHRVTRSMCAVEA